MQPNLNTLSEHLYGFTDAEGIFWDMADFATLLRSSDAAQLAARRCLELAPRCVSEEKRQALRLGGGALDPLRFFLFTRYARVAEEWALAKLGECDVGEGVLYCGWECRVEADEDLSRHLRCDGLRFADVTPETVVARKKKTMTTEEMHALIKAARDFAALLPKHPSEAAISERLQDYFSLADALLLRSQAQNDELSSAVIDLREDACEMRGRIAELEACAEQLRVQLAGCGVAALGSVQQVAVRGDYGWSQSYQDVLESRIRADKIERERDDLRARAEAMPAPPVVPSGWWVDRWVTGDNGEPEVHNESNGLWRLSKACDEEAVPVLAESEDDTRFAVVPLATERDVPADAVAALLFAIRTGVRPLHAGDVPRHAGGVGPEDGAAYWAALKLSEPRGGETP